MAWTRFFACCGCAALLLSTADAAAYCRTTTSKAPNGWNPAESGCWTPGTALAWKTDKVPYAVSTHGSKQVSQADAARIAGLAFAAWNGATCGGKPLGVQAYEESAIDVPDGDEGDALAGWAYCSESSDCNATAHDVIVFDDDAWPYSDPVNTLALTTVTFGQEDGAIFEAYTEVNSAQHKLTTQEPPPAGSTAYDLQAILTHEAGHFLGLAHATETSSIMYAYYQPGAVTLTADDVAGICAAYPPGGSSGCSCAQAGAGDAAAATTAGASLVALVTAAVLRRRRR